MNFAEHVKALLLQDISSIVKQSKSFVNHPGKDFTRIRKISMQNLIEFYLAMESGILQHELLKYFHFRSETASVSAFLQQRNKLKPEIFLHLLQRFNTHFNYQKHKGTYRLISCDGSEFNIPLNEKDTDSYYPPSGKSKRIFNMLHVIPLFDLLNRRFDISLRRIFCRTQSKKKRLHPEYDELYKFVSSNVKFDYISKDMPEYAMKLIATAQFHCKNREYIGMKIYTRMVLYNFCSIINRTGCN